MASVRERYSYQTSIWVDLKTEDVERIIGEHAAKVAGCDLTAENIKVESVKVREADRSGQRATATAEVHLMVLHSPGAIDSWVERREQQAAQRRAETPEPLAPQSKRYSWVNCLSGALALLWFAWAALVSLRVF